jgi:hypothetical protein
VGSAGVVAGVLLLSGCAPYSVDTSGNATLVTETTDDGVRNLMLITGRLTVTDDGCFGLNVGGVEHPAVFPVGTEADRSTLTVPGLGDVAVGERIEAGGGYLRVADLPADFPQECRADEILLINPFD